MPYSLLLIFSHVKRYHKEVGPEALDKIFELKRHAFAISF